MGRIAGAGYGSEDETCAVARTFACWKLKRGFGGIRYCVLSSIAVVRSNVSSKWTANAVGTIHARNGVE
jgi:hypothetical protein